jgi:hypothetical protein
MKMRETSRDKDKKPYVNNNLNIDDDGKSINDTEFALNRIGIAIRNNKGQFKEFDTVLQEFMQKFKSGQLSQVDYLAGIQALAGKSAPYVQKCA